MDITYHHQNSLFITLWIYNGASTVLGAISISAINSINIHLSTQSNIYIIYFICLLNYIIGHYSIKYIFTLLIKNKWMLPSIILLNFGKFKLQKLNGINFLLKSLILKMHHFIDGMKMAN
jgi:hypothetical protein